MLGAVNLRGRSPEVRETESPGDRKSEDHYYWLLTIDHSPFTTINMNELIQRLTTEAGLTPEQAQKAVAIIAGFVKEKFPMLGGAVDQIFAAGAKEEE